MNRRTYKLIPGPSPIKKEQKMYLDMRLKDDQIHIISIVDGVECTEIQIFPDGDTFMNCGERLRCVDNNHD